MHRRGNYSLRLEDVYEGEGIYFFLSHKPRCSNLDGGTEHPDFRVLLKLVSKYRDRIRLDPH
jgi:hypothetical protein